MEDGIEIISPGLYTSVQQGVRFGYRKYGVPDSGSMDRFSAALANQLVRNPPDGPLIEITISGPKILFHTSVTIALAGADLSPAINGVAIKQNKRHLVRKGDLLSFGAPVYGALAYLAIAGCLGSREEAGGPMFRKDLIPEGLLHKGQFVRLEPSVLKGEGHVQVRSLQKLFGGNKILVHEGPEFASMTNGDREKLFSHPYVVSRDSNRIGIRLEGHAIKMDQTEILTGPVIPGTVQLPPSGLPIVLMKDGQTTGGYPRILCLPEFSMARLAQKKPGESVQFRC